MLITDPITTATVLIWAVEHLHIPAIVYGIWKASAIFKDLSGRALKVEDNINTLSTNHFPHMEASLANQDVLMKSMDSSLKKIAEQTSKKKK